MEESKKHYEIVKVYDLSKTLPNDLFLPKKCNNLDSKEFPWNISISLLYQFLFIYTFFYQRYANKFSVSFCHDNLILTSHNPWNNFIPVPG